MIREPYYSSSSATSYIKPSNPKIYSFISHDLPTINSNHISVAPSYQLSAIKLSPPPTTSHGSKSSLRRNSVEPYYTKAVKIGTLPPRISSIFKYTFVDDEDDIQPHHRQKDNSDDLDDYAVLSDSDNEPVIDSDDDSDNGYLFFGKSKSVNHHNVLKPPSSGESLSRKVSDNYTSRYELDTDSEDETILVEEFNKLMRPIKATKSDNNLFNLKPPHLQSLNELNDSLLQKSNNPNVLTNVRSRTISENLVEPPKLHMKVYNYEDIFTHPAPLKIGYDRDDYDYGFETKYLI
ncbi:uncharacterized protein RJT21DRAFT_114800 [Scheffersomyces amazonensis]|uniref:uncharacterized protein n=1 Tax=Scheffersomyces amazonensis TaxID=1078765 RepID=UPI00315D89EF